MIHLASAKISSFSSKLFCLRDFEKLGYTDICEINYRQGLMKVEQLKDKSCSYS